MRRRALQWVQLPDGRCELGWFQNGLPTFPFGMAPQGLATRRQLRKSGLCPGGHPMVAQVVWAGGREWAGLYRLDRARPKRTPSPRQAMAIAKATATRRCCRDCGRDLGSYLPRALRLCWICDEEEVA